jgi:hypothetical protein
MKHRRTILILLGNIIAAFLLADAMAQDTQGYIYGTVKTFDQTYQGQIRWGNEEIFWNDYFNAAKEKNDSYSSYSDKNEKSWNDFDWSLESIWEDKIGLSHQFSCEFGDIKTLKDFTRSELTLVLKNNAEIRLNGTGYNDVGTTLKIKDNEIGEVSVKWDRIERIDFQPTPKDLNVRKGKPIYGTVETYRKGTFTGFIQWDHDERIGTDKLDGDNRDGDVSIAFSEIKYIEKKGDGCIVEMKSGREFYLTNSNDVDNSNRGIIMTVPGVGKIDIPWKYFINAKLTEAPNSGWAYTDYKSPKGLFGTVYTIQGDEFKGQIIYDLDEKWEIETLDANDDDVKYQIAFRNIDSIVPKNYAYSMIELKNGDKILLGGERDVSDKNDGLLVYGSPNSEPEFIKWDKIVEINFD